MSAVRSKLFFGLTYDSLVPEADIINLMLCSLMVAVQSQKMSLCQNIYRILQETRQLSLSRKNNLIHFIFNLFWRSLSNNLLSFLPSFIFLGGIGLLLS